MSHFTVLVIGENPEEQLAPFQENNMGDCPKEYLEFNNTEDEMKEEYENDTTEVIEVPGGKLVSKYDDSFYNTKKGSFEREFALPKGCVLKTVPFTEMYKTFDEFAEDYHGYKERDSLTGKYGYWENPNAKWDWHSLGGRWTGIFKCKQYAEGVLGTPGVFNNEPRPGYCDQLRISEIDFEGMREDAAKEAEDTFDKVMKVINGRELPPRWDDVRKKYAEDDIQKARDEYHNHSVIRDLQKENIMPFLEELRDVYCDFDKEKYIQKQKDTCISTFAVIKDGIWYERGSMGWWGIVSDEKESSKWEEEFQKLISNLPPDTLLSVYDCHI